MSDSVGFFGFGNMADAIAQAMYQNASSTLEIIAYEKHPDRIEWLRHHRPYISMVSADELDADTVFLGVKPQHLASVAPSRREPFASSQCIVSMLAGVSIQTCRRALNHPCVIRMMPNMPAVMSESATAVYIPDGIDSDQNRQVMNYLRYFGSVFNVSQESDLDTMTAISGSGPAFFYRMAQAFVSFGVSHGLPETMAKQAVVQTMLGSSKMLAQYPADALIEAVKSPNGTTQNGLNAMDEYGFDDIIHHVLSATYVRAIELNKEYNACES